MPTIKKIWRDNTMPPTNYVWMKTNLKGELIGIYEWYNGEWRPIKGGDEGDTYTKEEVDLLIQAAQQVIIDGLANGIYEIGNIQVAIEGLDSKLISDGTASSGTVVADKDTSQDESEEVNATYVLTEAEIQDGKFSGGKAIKIEGIPEEVINSIFWPGD